MEKTNGLKTLYGISSTGKIKQWEILAVEHEDGTASVITRSGYVDGKIKETGRTIRKGKNIGKSNETTPFEQAASEAISKWTAKRHENYEPYLMDPKTYVPTYMLPMLAKPPGKGKIVYPAFIQPKLNGVCDLAEVDQSYVHHHTRGGHVFTTLDHLNGWIHALKLPGPAHGEIYKHGWSLQKISSYTKEIKPDQHLIEYWLYDMACPTMLYEARIRLLSERIALLPKDCPIKFTPTYPVKNYDEAKQYHDSFVVDGFEGAMLKNAAGLYIFQYNSKDIEKVKEFQDAEFQIVGGKQGEGADEGCIVYRCATKEGLEFDVRPRGTVEERQKLFQELDAAIGQPLTVRFPEYTESGIPSQPVGIVVRDYE
jgi:DNA ligase-1